MTHARDFVFNIVWTGTVFTHLRYLVASQMAHSGARFRFLANGCPPEQVTLMERFAERHPDRVVEVLVTSPTMVNHGAALDASREQRDDGDHFCFVDPDIFALGPFLGTFADALDGGCAAITSGRGVWCEDDRVPPGHPGVAGEHFRSQDGFLFGSPHFAMYRSGPLAETIERWGVSFVSAGRGLSDEAQARLREAGHDYFIFDTGKLVNIFLQESGHRLCHQEHPNLVHVGGVSHYLAPTGHQAAGADGGDPEPDWQVWNGMEARFEVARFTAHVLRAVAEGRPAPPVPEGLDPVVAERLAPLRSSLMAVVEQHRHLVDG
ncbi:MAG: hypothetical protein ACLGI8_05510 [Acidimicrobiia bacterium]